MAKALHLILKLFGIIPFSILYIKSFSLYLFLYKIYGYRTDVVRENLKKSFPKFDNEKLKKIERKSYQNFCDVLLENLKLLTISKTQLRKRVKLLNPEILQDLKTKNKGAILIGAHYNNWEWMALAISDYAPQEVYSVYKPLSNQTIDKVMLSARSRFGANIIPMSSYPKIVLKNKGKSTLNIMLADQSPHKNKVDFYCNFLNQDTPVYLGAEKLMKAANLELLFVEVHRVKRGFYEMKIVSLADKPLDEVGATTLLHVNHLEKLINTNPQNWLWSHRRWKHSRKK